MSVRGCLTSLAVLCAAVLLSAPTAARADGDPASDVLLLQDSYLPYSPPVSAGVSKALTQVLKETRSAGYPLKVAVIASPQDLGSVPNMFGQPQQYAQFLGSEIAFNSKVPLLVVMPAGFGLDNVSANAGSALKGLTVSTSSGSDGLARSAIDGAVALARAAGHPVAAPKIQESGRGGSATPAIVFGAPVALLALAGLLMTLRRRSAAGEAPAPTPEEAAAPRE